AGGVYVSTVRSPDNKTDWIVTGAGEGGGTQVRVLKLDGTPVGGFFNSDDTNGVRVAGASFNGSLPCQLAGSEGPCTVPLLGLRRINCSFVFLCPSGPPVESRVEILEEVLMASESRPLVSVIIVNYKGASDTATCLEACCALDWPSDQLELIVVDNASG